MMYIKRDLQIRREDGASVLHEFFAVAYLNGSATFVYLIGLIFGLYVLIRYADWWRIPFFIAMILLLFLLDYLEYRRYGDKPPASAAVLILCLRFLCTTVAALLPPGSMIVLYLSFPYRSTLYFGPKAGYAVATLIILVFIGFLLFDLHASHRIIITDGDTYFIGLCIWVVLKAQSFRREREAQQREYQSRIRAEGLLEEVRRSHHQLSIYTEQVATLATIEERNRVAREIHDSLGHSLTAIHLQLEKALTYYSADSQVALQSVRDARDVAREALQDVRRSVRALRTEEQPFSCTHEIEQLGAQLRQHGLTVDFVATGREEAFSRRVLTTLYRIAQEACTNIQRHALANNVQISLDFGSQSALLQVSDDGIGFDTSRLEWEGGNKQSYGILGMQERLRLVTGVLQIESIPGQGTQLTATISKQGKDDLEAKMPLITERREGGTDGTGK
jgi:signal transduction histidine kinase